MESAAPCSTRVGVWRREAFAWIRAPAVGKGAVVVRPPRLVLYQEIEIVFLGRFWMIPLTLFSR